MYRTRVDGGLTKVNSFTSERNKTTPNDVELHVFDTMQTVKCISHLSAVFVSVSGSVRNDPFLGEGFADPGKKRDFTSVACPWTGPFCSTGFLSSACACGNVCLWMLMAIVTRQVSPESCFVCNVIFIYQIYHFQFI